MKKLWHRVSSLGVDSTERNLYNRTLILSNQLNIIMLFILASVFIFLMVQNLLQHTRWGIGSQRVLIMMILNLFNLVLAGWNHTKLSKVFLIFLPSAIFFIFPTLVGFVEEESFAYYPFIVIAFSVIPQILLVPVREKLLYYISFIYFITLLLFMEPFLEAFMTEKFEIVSIIKNFYLINKIVQVAVFIFLHLAIYQLRNINIRFEAEITDKNNALIIQNIELNNTLRDLDEAQKLLYQSERMTSLGTLTAGMAHEMNNPLNYIAGGLEMVEEVRPKIVKDLKPTEAEDYNNAIQIIKKGFEKAKKIVDAFISFTAKKNPEMELVEIDKLIDNTILFMRYKFPKELNVRKKYLIPFPVMGYKDKLQQVFHSILDNAVAAILSKKEYGNEYIDIETHLNKSDKQDSVIIDISNTGPEISDDDMPQIFDPFFTTKETGTGTGLGLNLAYSYVSAHKGTLTAENTGTGVHFRIRFPLTINK